MSPGTEKNPSRVHFFKQCLIKIWEHWSSDNPTLGEPGAKVKLKILTTSNLGTRDASERRPMWNQCQKNRLILKKEDEQTDFHQTCSILSFPFVAKACVSRVSLLKGAPAQQGCAQGSGVQTHQCARSRASFPRIPGTGKSERTHTCAR